MALTASGVFFSFFEHHQRSLSQIGAITSAAGDFGFAVGVFADEFALGFGTVGFGAFPVTTGVFANCFAFGFRGLNFIEFDIKVIGENEGWLLGSGSHSEVVCKL